LPSTKTIDVAERGAGGPPAGRRCRRVSAGLPAHLLHGDALDADLLRPLVGRAARCRCPAAAAAEADDLRHQRFTVSTGTAKPMPAEVPLGL
jgi:hypothetical protein